MDWYSEIGLADTELSFELTLAQAARLGAKLPRGLVIYGRLPLMLCRNCPAANSAKGCLHCKTAPELTDRKGIRFPMQCFGACTEILNSVPLSLSDRYSEIKGQDFGVLRFTTEDTAEADRVIGNYLDAMRGSSVSGMETGFTRGLYYRGIQ